MHTSSYHSKQVRLGHQLWLPHNNIVSDDNLHTCSHHSNHTRSWGSILKLTINASTWIGCALVVWICSTMHMHSSSNCCIHKQNVRMRVCVCIHICTRIHTLTYRHCFHTQSHPNTHTRAHTHVNTLAYTYVHTHTYTCTHVHAHTQTQTQSQSQTQTLTLTRTHILACTCKVRP